MSQTPATSPVPVLRDRFVLTQPATQAPLPFSRLLQCAGAALDDLVADLIKCSRRLPRAFFDWIGEEATMMVMVSLENLHDHPRFQASLQLSDDPMPAMRRWVRHWICPHLVARFETLAEFFPEFQASQPAAL